MVAAHEAWRAAFPTMELDDLKTEKPKAPQALAGSKLPVVTPDSGAQATEALAAARAAHAAQSRMPAARRRWPRRAMAGAIGPRSADSVLPATI